MGFAMAMPVLNRSGRFSHEYFLSQFFANLEEL